MFLKKFVFKMSEVPHKLKNIYFKNNIRSITKNTYEEAIEALNALQSNATYLHKKKVTKLTPEEEYKSTILLTQKYLLRSGISLDRLDDLSVIHITGTKGKGSTGAYCESILRHHGYRTGFYISPHLVEVRERIQIDGKPISRDVFRKYFWDLYETLLKKREDAYDMPIYFRFLTVLAYNIFIKENVDVAIIEVGIGGEYDCTNILRKVPIVAITSLGMDHMSLLGDSIEEIAWQKSGIMKKGCRAFTVPQDQKAMQILRERSLEKNCTLEVVDAETNCLRNLQQQLNVKLAMTLAKNWITSSGKGFISESNIKDGISNCFWPGRYQVIQKGNVMYYLDGAHTPESMKSCCKWFNSKTRNDQKIKILIFNTIGDRNSEHLLKQLVKCEFDYAYFVPNVATANNSSKDFVNYNITEDVQLKRCLLHKDVWSNLVENEKRNETSEIATIYPTVSHVLNDLNVDTNYTVLTTGSLHLVGAMLSILDPELTGTDLNSINL